MSLTNAKMQSLGDKHLEIEKEEAKKLKVVSEKTEKKLEKKIKK